MVRRYNPVKPSDIGLFADWMEMQEDEILQHIDQHRDPRIWTMGDDGNWQLGSCVTNQPGDTPQIENAKLSLEEECVFRVCNNREPDQADDSYIIIGKGFVDQASSSNPLNHHCEMPKSSAVS